MKALIKILGFAVAALIVVAFGFYFIEVYASSPPLAGFEVTTEGRRDQHFDRYAPALTLPRRPPIDASPILPATPWPLRHVQTLAPLLLL